MGASPRRGEKRRSGTSGAIIRYAPSAAAALLAVAVAWAPLPYGSVEPEAVALLRLASAVLLALAVPALYSGSGVRRLEPARWPAAALLAVAALGLVQAAAWPPSVVAALSPGHAEAWAASGEILAALEEDAGREADAAGTEAVAEPAADEPDLAWPHLSLDPAASRGVALNALALAALFTAATLVGRHRRHRRWLAAGLAAGALFQVLYGGRQLLAGSLEVWGVEVLGLANRMRGTYVNPNHTAYLLEIAAAVAFAAVVWALARARRQDSLERRLLLVVPTTLVWLTSLAGLVLTRSRAGLLAVLVAMTVQGLLVAARRRHWRWAPVGLGAVVVGLGIVAAAGAQQGLGRFFGTSVADVSWQARWSVTRLTAELWSRFPLTGTGLGTFADAFPVVATEELQTSSWLHAHNDYAELAATAGLLGLGLVAVGLVALVRRLQGVLLHGRRSEDRAAALAALGALAAVAVHEAFDFGLTLAANSFVLVAVCGAAAGARRFERSGSERQRQ